MIQIEKYQRVPEVTDTWSQSMHAQVGRQFRPPILLTWELILRNVLNQNTYVIRSNHNGIRSNFSIQMQWGFMGTTSMHLN